MPLFRKRPPEEPLVIAMTGVRLGLRVLVLGGDAVDVPVDVATRVGLTGQAVALAPTQEVATRIVDAAQRKGVLLEPAVLESRLPYDDAAFDLVIADDRSGVGRRTEPALLGEAYRALRPGGRLVIIRPAPGRSRLFGRQSTDDEAELRRLFDRVLAAGFRTVRTIGTSAGSTFIEAARSA